MQTLIIQAFSPILPAIVFSAERDPHAKEFCARLLTYFLVATTFMGLGVSVLADDVLRLMADPDYWDAAIVVPWICLAFMLYGIRGLVSVRLALKRQNGMVPNSA